ncbi:MAG: hypothetical protein A2259_01280 [Candidatus Moranbacteria bacterium RIFOXYA2_FULL_43_15]|nr:MAG: hypothetical protein A2259_01280 [Candidatus Moranbacteria bacterium RIFOXYA2_FULL_43_15]
MHCVACEKLLEDELAQVPFVKKIEADRKKGEVEIYWTKTEPNSSAMEEIIKKVGYEASEMPWEKTGKNKTGWKEWLSAAVAVAVALLTLHLFQNSGLVSGVNIDNSNINYGVSFLVGLVASVSSCLAVVGAVVIAFSEKYKTNDDTFFEGSVKPNLLFHLGRLAAFFILGGALGFFGGELNISGSFVSFYTVLIAIVMAWLGLNILGIAPGISEAGIRMPKGFTKHWSKLKESNHQAAPLILGALSFFLPCGFTQSMQIFALASGSFLAGGTILFFFALGTAPVLLALGVAASWTKSEKIVVFKKAAGLVVLVFAVYTFSSGLAVWGAKGNLFASEDKAGADASPDAARDKKDTMRGNSSIQEQVVEMHVTNAGFSPSVLKVKKGVPVRWVIKGDEVSSCTNKIIVPSLDLKKNINSGDNVLVFTPEKSGEIPFSCWMGMVRGKFIVE